MPDTPAPIDPIPTAPADGVFAYYLQHGAVPPNPLTTLRADIRAHWAEHRPQMFKRLKVSGKLEQAIETAFQLTDEALLARTTQGEQYLNAWEAVRQDYAFLPTEEDEPVLGQGEPETWQFFEAPDEDA